MHRLFPLRHVSHQHTRPDHVPSLISTKRCWSRQDKLTNFLTVSLSSVCIISPSFYLVCELFLGENDWEEGRGFTYFPVKQRDFIRRLVTGMKCGFTHWSTGKNKRRRRTTITNVDVESMENYSRMIQDPRPDYFYSELRKSTVTDPRMI